MYFIHRNRGLWASFRMGCWLTCEGPGGATTRPGSESARAAAKQEPREAAVRALFQRARPHRDPQRRSLLGGDRPDSIDSRAPVAPADEPRRPTMETIPSSLPRGEVRLALKTHARDGRLRATDDPAPAPRAHPRPTLTIAPRPSPAQDGYVKWDDVDVSNVDLPAGDDMGIPRCAPRHPPASTPRSPRAGENLSPRFFPRARPQRLRARAARRSLPVPITR